MAVARQTDATLVKILEGAEAIPVLLGATVEAGEAITLQSDGYWDPCDTSAAQLNVGIALIGGVAGDRVPAAFAGARVSCITGGTPGNLVYASDTAGEFSDTVGTKDLVVGYAWSATVLFIQPQIIDFS